MFNNLPLDGGITDGDDHVWTDDVDVLLGGGGWCGLDCHNSQPAAALGKHVHAQARLGESENDQESGGSEMKAKRVK
jgi:hypothetical protein